MKVILVDQKHGRTRTLVAGTWMKGLLSLGLLGIPVATGVVGYQLAAPDDADASVTAIVQSWAPKIEVQAEQLADIKAELEQHLDTLTVRLATMQARLVRLDALGERITSVARLDDGEFDFGQPVPLGGPETASPRSYSHAELSSAVDQLEQQLDDRQQQLEILENLITDRQSDAEALVAGRPIVGGWIASHFGERLDPITGRMSFHTGVDFTTGEAGADIHTVASGVVTWSGPRSEYGLMVEVNHGNGFATRYAHSEKLLVGVGDIVKKGQTVALMGSTGRSTGPHVHFEVYKNGRVVDPAAYIHRVAR